jgi:N-acetylneuraminate synthase
MKIQIKPGLEIGGHHPTFIIAEIGSNWETLDDCLGSIQGAKQCGADAVKFQLLSDGALYGLNEHASFNMRRDWFPKLKAKADQVGIEFMCSAFDPYLIDIVNPFVNIHKLASAEMCHVRMLEKFREIGKPLIMSTGAHSAWEIEKAMEVLGPIPLVLMYCVAAYPARVIDLSLINALKYRFKTEIGYSDHSTDVLCIPVMAAIDACVLEKHVTFFPELETPDRGHSLIPSEFKRMVSRIRGENPGLELGANNNELDMVFRHNRRLMVIRDIAKGERFIEGENFGIYRAQTFQPYQEGQMLTPFDVNRVHESISTKDLKVGSAIYERDFN